MSLLNCWNCFPLLRHCTYCQYLSKYIVWKQNKRKFTDWNKLSTVMKPIGITVASNPRNKVTNLLRNHSPFFISKFSQSMSEGWDGFETLSFFFGQSNFVLTLNDIFWETNAPLEKMHSKKISWRQHIDLVENLSAKNNQNLL